MELNALFMKSFTSANFSKSSSSLTSQNGASSFESFLNSTDKTVSNEAIKSDKPYKKEFSVKDKNTNTDKNSKNNDKTKTKDASDEKKVNEKTSSKVEGKPKETKSSKETEDEIVDEVSKLTGISTDEIQNILSTLGMNVMDLSEPNNLLNFMQKIYDVATPIELLSIDGVKDLMSKMKDLLDSMKALNFSDSLNDEIDLNMEELASQLTEDDAAKSSDEEALGKLEENTDAIHLKNLNGTDNFKEFNFGDGNQGAFNQNFQNGNSENSSSSLNGENVVLENINKAFNAVMSKTESAKGTDSTHVVNQIIEKIKVGFTSEISEIRITLKPEQLGDVTLKIASQNGIVTAMITTENQRIKEIIEANFNLLRDSLAEQGIEVSQLEVNVGTGNSDDFGFGRNMQDSEKSDRRIEDLIDEAFSEEEAADSESTYVNDNEILNANVNYTV